MKDRARAEVIYRMAQAELPSWTDDLATAGLTRDEAFSFTVLLLGMMTARMIHADYDEKHGADERIISGVLAHVRGHALIELEILRQKETITH